MNRLAKIIIALIFLNQCSFNENSRIWKAKEIENNNNIKKIFSVENKITAEFNQELKLDLSKIRTNYKIINN
ncbi:dehydrogenase, partial [Candidatus Pelagibacter sp.]|nr:dehydrogenase [Candidatus Pelagibacter sp.]